MASRVDLFISIRLSLANRFRHHALGQLFLERGIQADGTMRAVEGSFARPWSSDNQISRSFRALSSQVRAPVSLPRLWAEHRTSLLVHTAVLPFFDSLAMNLLLYLYTIQPNHSQAIYLMTSVNLWMQ